MRWDPVQYARYSDERSRPFHDLLARVDHPAPRRVVDLGCGTGELTASLARRWPEATVQGIDSSGDMIERAQAISTGRLGFELADIGGWDMPADADVVVSNAALQWVPGHQDLLRRWAATLPDGAVLAFQVPSNFDAPSHALMRAVAASPPWSSRLTGQLWFHNTVSSAQHYAALLLDCGLSVDAWETSYVHQLSGADPVLEWVRGTGLRPVLAALSQDEARHFEADYGARLREAYPPGPQGTLFPFRRVFVVARR